ncbi:carbamoyltransferase N-terminal domain-containing protein [Streptomyces sp. NPDC006435]|uniref:carbamoyltransferase N-terminal domain-containing protein n=1 Tax=Streptomyces sp. NPDC006435 TaxID=3154300 RepID=UPI0033B13299
MAYAALGRVEKSAHPIFDGITDAFPATSPDKAELFGKKIAVNRDELLPGLSDADLIATFQAYLGDLLLHRLSTVLRRGLFSPTSTGRPASCARPNLVIGGGCALNIKRNSMLRASSLFDDIWIAPFPNDSGAAIGTATCEMFRVSGHPALEWDVYSGPRIAVGGIPQGWQENPVTKGSWRSCCTPKGNRSSYCPAGPSSVRARWATAASWPRPPIRP